MHLKAYFAYIVRMGILIILHPKDVMVLYHSRDTIVVSLIKVYITQVHEIGREEQEKIRELSF